MAEPQAPHLTSAQVDAMQIKIRQAIQATFDNVGLRKLAMESALKLQTSDPVALAEKIYAFYAAPAGEVVVRIEQ